MRRIRIVLLICVFAVPVHASPPSPTPPEAGHKPESHSEQHEQGAVTDQRGTENAPVFIKVIPPLALEPYSVKENDKHHDYTSPEWWLVYITATLVAVTFGLMIYTAFLWRSTQALAVDAKLTAARQAAEMQESLRIARESSAIARDSADAAVVASMPVLSPLIVGGALHPFRSAADKFYPTDQPITFESTVQFIFENFGKTPGMIREVRGGLFLCEMDQFPEVDFGQLPVIDYQPIVAGDSRGEKAMLAVAEYAKTITLTQTEFTELLVSEDNRHRRFAFIGRVVYDDFFENRHTRRFCIKTRRMDNGLFQIIRGGRAYNHVDRQKTPENE